MIIKIQARFDNCDDTKTATQVVTHEEMWISLEDILLVHSHPTIVNALGIVYGKGQRRLVVCRDVWLDAVKEYGIGESAKTMHLYPQAVKDLIKDQLKDHIFTTIIGEDGRTLESFPRGLAGLEVRVKVLGNPWEAGK